MVMMIWMDDVLLTKRHEPFVRVRRVEREDDRQQEDRLACRSAHEPADFSRLHRITSHQVSNN